MAEKSRPLQTVINFDEDFIADVSSNDESVAEINKSAWSFPAQHHHSYSVAGSTVDFPPLTQPDVVTMIREKQQSKESSKGPRRAKQRSQSKSLSSNKPRDVTPTKTVVSSSSASPEPQQLLDAQGLMLLDENALDSGLDDVSLAEEDRLRLRNNRLQGRLSVVGSEAKTWLTERAQFSAEVFALKGQLNSSKTVCEHAITQSEERAKELALERQNFDKKVQHLHDLLSLKQHHVDKISCELQSSRDEQIRFKILLDKREQNNAIQDSSFAQLKDKITTLYVELADLKSTNLRIVDESGDLSEKVQSLLQSRDWYAQELASARAQKEKLDEHLVSMGDKFRQGAEQNHNLAHDNACLRSQLVLAKSAHAEEKRSTGQKLAEIKAQMQEREAMFERLSREREHYTQLAECRAAELHQTQQQLQSLAQQELLVKDQLGQLTGNHQDIMTQLGTLAQHRENLMARCQDLEDQLKAQCAMAGEQHAQVQAITGELQALQAKTSRDTEELASLRQERDHLNQLIEQAHMDKQSLESFLQLTREELQQHDQQMAQLVEDLGFKTQQLAQMQSEVAELREVNATLLSNLQAKEAEMATLGEEKRVVDEALTQLQEQTATMKGELGSLRDELVVAQQQLRESQEHHSRDKAVLQGEIGHHLGQIAQLIERLAAHDELMTRYETLTREHDRVKSQAQNDQARAREEAETLVQQLKAMEHDHAEERRKKQAALDHLVHVQAGNLANIKELESQVVVLEQGKRQALDEQASEWSMKLVQVERQLAETEGTRTALDRQLEQARASLEQMTRGHAQAEQKYAKQLQEVQAQASQKQQESEDSYKRLLSEIEHARGRNTGLVEAYNTLKLHARSLEQNLEQKEMRLAELSNEAEQAQRESLFHKSLFEETSSPRISTCREQIMEEPLVQMTHVGMVQSAALDGLQDLPQIPLDELEKPIENIAMKAVKQERDILAQEALEASKQAQEALALNELLRMEQNKRDRELEQVQRLYESQSTEKAGLLGQVEDSSREAVQLREQLARMAKELGEARERNTFLERQTREYESSYEKDLDAFQRMIKATTDHVTQLKSELSLVTRERDEHSLQLQHVRGQLAGLLQVYPEREGDQGFMYLPRQEVQDLLAHHQPAYLAESKPISTLQGYMDTLQNEVDRLEDEIVEQNTILHDSVDFWKRLHREMNNQSDVTG